MQDHRGSADQSPRRWLAENEAMVVAMAAPQGSVCNDAGERDSQSQRKVVAGGAPTNKWVVLGLVVVGTFMTTLDVSIVNISLPSIARTFHPPFGGAVEWVIIAYLIPRQTPSVSWWRLVRAILPSHRAGHRLDSVP